MAFGAKSAYEVDQLLNPPYLHLHGSYLRLPLMMCFDKSLPCFIRNNKVENALSGSFGETPANKFVKLLLLMLCLYGELEQESDDYNSAKRDGNRNEQQLMGLAREHTF